MVAADGGRVTIDTAHISATEISTIGITGAKPRTAVPVPVREMRSSPPTDQRPSGSAQAAARGTTA